MPVLGINGLNGAYHDSGACLVLDDGEWVAAEEERLNRIKHSSGFPALSIEWCLKEAGIDRNDLDAAGYFLDMSTHYARYFLKTVYDHPGAADDAFCYGFRIYDYWRRRLHADMGRWLGLEVELLPVRHHLAHAASAYYPSPFDEAAVLTVDGAGDAESACYFLGRGREIRRLATPMVFPTSMGMLYNFVATHLGLGFVGSSGKLMGLAPYGRPTYDDAFRKIVRIPEKVDERSVITFDFDHFEYHLGGSHPIFSPRFLDLFGPPRGREEPILQRHADIAASMQRLLEDALLFFARQLRLLSGSRRLCYAGGVALNIDANIRIKEEAGFEELFIMPSAYDAGTSIGAALYLHHVRFGRPRVKPLTAAFRGPQHSEERMLAALKDSGLVFTRVAHPAAEAAALLAAGAIVGWFQGREEIGPRALGNRSILMDPGLPSGRELINEKVKFREAFRPFAPSVPFEDADRYFVSPSPSAFMLYAFAVRDEWRSRLAAVTHVDGSARVHTVTAEENPLFHRLLGEFGRRKGYSVLLNTSFNVQGQPMVSTPEQALEVFRHTGLDALVIGPFLLSRHDPARPRPLPVSRSLPEGVIDPGGSPPFRPFELPPARAGYPEGVELRSSEEKDSLQKALLRMRDLAASETDRGRAVRALAHRIDEAERDLEVQRRMGPEELPQLWESFARLWSDPSLAEDPLGLEDEYLCGRRPFPGQQPPGEEMAEPSGALDRELRK